MKKSLLVCLAAFFASVASAQKSYFLYLQTDEQIPFYVRLSDKIYSSAVSGYLILPSLLDSTYNLSVGFAKSTQPETKFSVTINQGDKGYLIKNFQEGLSLFDMQNLSVIKSVSATKDNTVYETKSDKFSAILSKAADDPGLLKVAVVKKEELKKDPVAIKTEENNQVETKQKDIINTTQIETVNTKTEKKQEPTAKVDSLVAKSVTNPVEDVKQPVKEENINEIVIEYKRSKVKRRSESSTTEGFGVVYFDRAEDYTDTIRILIPPSKIKVDDDTQTSILPEIKKQDEIISTETQPKNTDAVVEIKKESDPNMVTPTACQNAASEKDFMKLRKNMAAKSNDEDMIAEAKKTFKSRCFATEQIRYLGTLFLTSAAKYQFFDAAYNYVSDKKSFSSLQSELKDEYYLKRFKALVGE